MLNNLKIIDSYTREDALNDGTLVDVSKVGKEAGFKYSIAMSKALYEGYIIPPEEIKNKENSTDWRLWDSLFMLRIAISRMRENNSFILYSVYYQMNENIEHFTNRDYKLKALFHGGDKGEPVITIMFTEED